MKRPGSWLTGLLLLAAIFFLLWLARPWLAQLLPAADLAYLLKDGRYVVLFQNNAELRASGGFIGSYAELTVRNGRPEPIVFGTNIYKLDDPFTAQVAVPSPAPLAHINEGRWALRDANWAASFPEAAKQIIWFYEQETVLAGQPKTLDGVIGLTTTVVEELLRLTGPIDLPAYATTLTADNFAEVVQYKVEKEYFENKDNWAVDEPKTILKDFLPLLEERLRGADKTALTELVFRLLDEKYIVLFSADPLAQRIVLTKNWGGEVSRTKDNYLYVVNSNVQGGKSSRKITQRIRWSLNTASREATLYLERQHTGTDLWPDGTNNNWVRILVPRGCELLSARFDVTEIKEQIEVGREAGRTVFGFWMNTPPRQTQAITLIYKVPADVDLAKFVVQRQPGANPDELIVLVDNAERLKTVLKHDLDLSF